jgi:hypothetical protein
MPSAGWSEDQLPKVVTLNTAERAAIYLPIYWPISLDIRAFVLLVSRPVVNEATKRIAPDPGGAGSRALHRKN